MKIYFSPDCPTQQDYSIVAMIHHLGYSVVRDINDPFDVAYLWQDATFVTPPQELVDVAQRKPVLNLQCTDISKRTVDKVWGEICGYHSLVDPTKHDGKAIKKFDANGQGGGEVIDCPLSPSQVDASSDVVYQRYLDTEAIDAQLEYRVPIALQSMPLVFEVLKDDPEQVAGKRIKNQYKRSIVPKSTDDIFSREEQDNILRFCQRMGFDIGELDVLRCQSTGYLYVIDVNTTPTYFNMFNRYWRPDDKRRAISAVAESWAAGLAECLV